MIALACVLALLCANRATAAVGDLDASFSTDGFALGAELPDTYVEREPLEMQPDGRLIVAGGHSVARFLPSGAPDPSFGQGGQAGVLEGLDRIEDVALEPDGKVLATGVTNEHYVVARLDQTGAPDLTFGGGDGIAEIDVGFQDRSYALASQPDGRILVAGYAQQEGAPTGVAIARLTVDGQPDTGFSDDGQVFEAIRGAFRISQLEVRPNGRIVALVDGKARPLLLQYLPDGRRDAEFSGDGASKILDRRIINSYSFVLDTEGRILIQGASASPGEAPAIARLDPAGALDPSFGNDGIVQLGPVPAPHDLTPPVVRSLGVDAQSRPIVAGDGTGLVVGRLTASGTMDSSFSSDGWSLVYLRGQRFECSSCSNNYDIADIVATQDRIAVASEVAGRFVIARFTTEPGPADTDADGTPDALDPCPQQHGGCPRVGRRPVLGVANRGTKLFISAGGYLECTLRRKAAILQRLPGRDRVLITGDVRAITAEPDPLRGVYYARLIGAKRLPYGVCQAGTSRAVRLPRAQQRTHR